MKTHSLIKRIDARQYARFFFGMLIFAALLFSLLLYLIVGTINISRIGFFGQTTSFGQDILYNNLKDFHIVGNSIVSDSTDPNITLSMDPILADRIIAIEVQGLNVPQTTAQIFIRHAHGSFNESDSVRIFLRNGINFAQVPFSGYSSLRLDLAELVGVSMEIKQVELSRHIFLPLRFWGVFALGMFFGTLVFLNIGYLRCFIINIYGSSVMKNLVYVARSFIISFRDFAREFLQFITSHKWLVLLSAFLLFATFGYEIFNFSLSVDEEREIVGAVGIDLDITKLTWNEGRYGAYLFRQIETLDGIFTPFSDTLVACICLGLSAIVWCLNLTLCNNNKKTESLELLVFVGIYCSLPFVVTEVMVYSIANAHIAFAMLCSSCAHYFLIRYPNNPKRSYILWAVLLETWALLTYEAFTTFLITASCICIFLLAFGKQNLSFKDCIKLAALYVFTFISGFLIFIVSRLILGSNNYSNLLFKWGKDESLFQTAKKLIVWLRDLLIQNKIAGTEYMCYAFLLFSAFLLIHLILFWNRARVFHALLGICILMSPFANCFVAGGGMPLRSLVALPLACAMCWYIVLNKVNKRSLAGIILIGFSLLCMWRQIVLTNRVFYGGNLCSTLDREMGYNIGTDISRIVGRDKTSQTTVVFVGRYQHNSPNIIRLEAAGQSIFFRDNSQYKVFLLRHLGYEFRHANIQELKQAEQISANMPVWPAEGSIEYVDNLAVVKLS